VKDSASTNDDVDVEGTDNDLDADADVDVDENEDDEERPAVSDATLAHVAEESPAVLGRDNEKDGGERRWRRWSSCSCMPERDEVRSRR
jgi:hypothetical protein